MPPALDIGSEREAVRSDRIRADEAADFLGVTAQSFYRSVRLGHFPPNVVFRVGRSVRVSRKGLLEWIAAGGSIADRSAA